jgi:hypothetical protein
MQLSRYIPAAGTVFARPLTLAALVRFFARSDQASERPRKLRRQRDRALSGSGSSL